MWKCTEDMENVSLSPKMNSKVKNRNSANKIRHGSPRLQEVLRERCRQKMRERRGQLFNKSRFGLKHTLSEIVREQLNDLVTISNIVNEPLEPEEALELEAEILNEEEQWILQEYERMSEKEIEMLASFADQQAKDVICPVCKVSNLIEEGQTVSCKPCKYTIKIDSNLMDVEYRIKNSIDLHSMRCRETPAFVPNVEDDHLFLFIVCGECFTWNPVI
ncbi:unnamed protein product [Xylocopa violacea]|uniref:RPA-interacting protein n=1 Tax=Xylocopa violacea TaxID=135666 RepID=A0ABP1P8K1_XYLVO